MVQLQMQNRCRLKDVFQLLQGRGASAPLPTLLCAIQWSTQSLTLNSKYGLFKGFNNSNLDNAFR